jgi:hypothetical protein
MKLVDELGNATKVASSSTDSPIEVRMGGVVDG